MTRLLLAYLGLAALPLVAPQAATVAGPGARGESLRAAPTSEAPQKGALTPASSRPDDVRSADAMSVAAACCEHPAWPLAVEPGVGTPVRPTPGSAPALLPLPRAPPA